MVAIVHGGPLAVEQGDIVPDCRACFGDEYASNRARWGCDAPLTEGRAWQIACECGGVKRDCRREDCEDGWRPVMRCPRALLREAPEDVRRFLGSWPLYREHGILPGPGGMLDQPATFVQACAVADAEKGAWDRAREEWMKDQRERAKARGKRGR